MPDLKIPEAQEELKTEQLPEQAPAQAPEETPKKEPWEAPQPKGAVSVRLASLLFSESICCWALASASCRLPKPRDPHRRDGGQRLPHRRGRHAHFPL